MSDESEPEMVIEEEVEVHTQPPGMPPNILVNTAPAIVEGGGAIIPNLVEGLGAAAPVSPKHNSSVVASSNLVELPAYDTSVHHTSEIQTQIRSCAQEALQLRQPLQPLQRLIPQSAQPLQLQQPHQPIQYLQ